ncbi:hypothetical protein H2248_002987 [Termitomyces sp. 'cryptogamus']|nr:hypothetical protein H2248_002987 [Termitomyces sp. 'cryptogamus']
MSLRWSVPAPIHHETRQPILPNEIYLHIIDFVHYSVDWDEDDRRRSLSNLALSCVLFRGFIVPRIFKSLHCNGSYEDPKLRSAVNSAVFCRVLNSGKEPAISLARYVEECILLNWNSGAVSPSINAAFLDMYCRAFLRMPNLHKLSLSNMVIDAHLLKNICKLKNLRSLVLDSVDFARNLAEHLFKKMPPITSLRLHQLDIDEDQNVIARIVNVANVQTLSATKCAQVLPLLPHTLALVELYLTSVESTTALWDVISRLTALTTLAMECVAVQDDHSPPHQLSASSLPNLRRLTAPPSFSSVVADRSLSYINFMDGFQLDQVGPFIHLSLQADEVSRYFTRSSSSLISLLIPLEFYSIGPFCEKFPNLQNLTIMSGHPNFSRSHRPGVIGDDAYNLFQSTIVVQFINEVTAKWPPAPSVKSLRLELQGDSLVGIHDSVFLFDLELQRKFITRIVAAFPSVLRVQFFEYVTWTREPCGGKWTGHIPFEFHSRIRWDLSQDHVVRKDVDGLLLPFLVIL